MGQQFDEMDDEEYERRRQERLMRMRQEKIRQLKIRKLMRLTAMAACWHWWLWQRTGIARLVSGGDKKPSEPFLSQEVKADTEEEGEILAAKQPVMRRFTIWKSWRLIPQFLAGSRTKTADGTAMQTELFTKTAGRKSTASNIILMKTDM